MAHQESTIGTICSEYWERLSPEVRTIFKRAAGRAKHDDDTMRGRQLVAAMRAETSHCRRLFDDLPVVDLPRALGGKHELAEEELLKLNRKCSSWLPDALAAAVSNLGAGEALEPCDLFYVVVTQSTGSAAKKIREALPSTPAEIQVWIEERIPARVEHGTEERGVTTEYIYDAFISYRHEEPDKGFARELLKRLESRGYKVAIDERDFVANHTFLEEMERCVKQSAFTLCVLSPRYLASGNTNEEAIICKVLDMGERKRRLLPVVIERVAMPVWMYGIVGVRFDDSDPLVEPFERLVGTLGRPR